MPTFRIVDVPGERHPHIFFGDEELTRDEATFQDGERPMLSLLSPHKSAWLLADVHQRDPRIEILSLRYADLRLLARTWRAWILYRPSTNIVVVQCWPSWDQWTSVVSFAALKAAFVSIIDTSMNIMEKSDDDDLRVRFRLYATPVSLQNVVTACENFFGEKLEVAFKRAAADHPAAVISSFDFPAPVRSACEQYLLHFVDFLRDLGVDATADLRHEAGRVLFTVTPSDPAEALGMIRDALSAYLQLVDSSIEGDAQDVADQVTVDKLRMNILHLQAQLTAAGMMLRLQESTIAAQEVALDAQRRLLDGASTTRRGSEPVLSDIVEVLPLEGHGIRINLPELIRRLKRNFGQRKATSRRPSAAI